MRNSISRSSERSQPVRRASGTAFCTDRAGVSLVSYGLLLGLLSVLILFSLQNIGENLKSTFLATSNSLSEAASPSEPNDIVLVSGAREWRDGSYAASCYDYLFPVNGLTYTGDTGDGMYRIQPNGSNVLEVMCDMTRDSGGWTLVANWVGQESLGDWNDPAGTGTSSDGYSNKWALPDTTINTLSTSIGGFRGEGIDTNLIRYWKPSCTYSSIATPSPDCIQAYQDVNFATASTVSSSQICAWHRGLVSAYTCASPESIEFITNHTDPTNDTNYNDATEDDTESAPLADGRSWKTGVTLRIWVK